MIKVAAPRMAAEDHRRRHPGPRRRRRHRRLRPGQGLRGTMRTTAPGRRPGRGPQPHHRPHGVRQVRSWALGGPPPAVPPPDRRARSGFRPPSRRVRPCAPRPTAPARPCHWASTSRAAVSAAIISGGRRTASAFSQQGEAGPRRARASAGPRHPAEATQELVCERMVVPLARRQAPEEVDDGVQADGSRRGLQLAGEALVSLGERGDHQAAFVAEPLNQGRGRDAHRLAHHWASVKLPGPWAKITHLASLEHGGVRLELAAQHSL